MEPADPLLVGGEVVGRLDDGGAAEHVDEPQAVDVELADEEVVAGRGCYVVAGGTA